MADLDQVLRDNTISLETVKSYIHEISVQYNIDKKSILLKYIHYLIQQETYTPEILDMIGDILHNGDVKTETFLDFFVCEIRGKLL